MLNVAGLLTAGMGPGTLVLVALVPSPKERLTATLELEAGGFDLNVLIFGSGKAAHSCTGAWNKA